MPKPGMGGGSGTERAVRNAVSRASGSKRQYRGIKARYRGALNSLTIGGRKKKKKK